MRAVTRLGMLSLAALGALSLAAASTQAQTPAPAAAPPPPPAFAWVPKPIALTPYVAPMKPHTKLAEVLAKHRGQASWTELVVADNMMRAEYIQMAPGAKTKVQMLADHRLGIIVWDGQIKVSIQGQEPFIASKGFMIQVPFRVPYSLETVGDKPSLRFEAKPASATTLYGADETPPAAPPGQAWFKARLQGQDTYEREKSQPYLDFFKGVATPPGPRGAFLNDDRNFLNIIRGRGIPRQPDSVKGHFHVNYGEFWFIMEGQVSYLIEGMDYFVAEPGDIVYAAPGRWHRAAFAGDGMATRIAINGYPNGSHHYDPAE